MAKDLVDVKDQIRIDANSSVLNVCVCNNCERWFERLINLMKADVNMHLHYVDPKDDLIKAFTKEELEKMVNGYTPSDLEMVWHRAVQYMERRIQAAIRNMSTPNQIEDMPNERAALEDAIKEVSVAKGKPFGILEYK